ncbi:MAG TPA: ExeM/NucH family extracellular endonuclease [Candidatus Sulfomarinibacteraceae bacterium]|nr:ExeM/NucH family extracellular endonuclease [Candidatus Sulfomarinibacteraceae bacterium]
MNSSRQYSALFTLIVALLFAAAMGTQARGIASAAAPDLFFSEYIEGTSNNKALEIYNATGATIDLAAENYNVQMYFNGSSSAGLTIALEGTVANGDVFVLAQSSAVEEILDHADQTNGAGWFNGDDAVVLRKDTEIIDRIGQVGFDPGSQWGSGDTSTQDNTLRRKADICEGDTNFEEPFDPADEWVGFPTNTFDGLGTHTSTCNGAAPEPDDPVINEFVFNHTGTDTHEYVEVFGSPNTDYSTYAVLQIEGDGTGAGVIDSVHPVGTTDANGLWVTDFLSNVFENGTVTLLLVEGFDGSQGDDLDIDNDGVLDTEPWTRIVDDLAVSDGGASDHTYASTVLVANFDGGSFTVGGASRIPNGVDTDSVSDWMRNDFDGEGLPGFAGTPEPGEAVNTPGAINVEGSAPPASNVIINEIDSDTPGTDVLEFVELYDGGEGNTSLDGLVVVFFNGNGDTSYARFDLDGHSTDENGYFLLGNEAVEPTPSIIFGSNGLQNGPDAVALFQADAGDFPNGTPVTTDNLIDAIVYGTNDPDATGLLVLLNDGQGQVNESGGGDSTIHSLQRCPNGAGGARNTDAYVPAQPTPGAANDCDDGGGDEIGFCGDPATFIHEIQGSGLTSPLVGETVVVEGVVVGDFQNNAEPDHGDLNGFFVQEEDADADDDPATSEGIFVFSGGLDDVSVGQQVRVAGDVVEFGSGSSITELTNVSDLLICGDAELPTVTDIELPVTSIDDFERYEGMLVRFPQELVVAEYFNYDRFGEMVLALPLGEEEDGGRPQQPTAIAEPGSEAAAIAEANALRRITLDDGRTAQNPDPAIHPNGNEFTLDNRFRGGDIVQNVVGVMDDAFGLYRIQPTEQATYIPANPRPEAPDDVGGRLTVASFNVLNYFTTIDTGAEICGPTGGQDCRGADTLEEFERQRAKIIAALSVMDADIVGLIELENHPDDDPIADLVQGLNDVMGDGAYAYVPTGAIGSDAIRQGLIYKPATVIPIGDYAILDSTVDSRFDDDKNRPVLAQTFMEAATGDVVTVAVNHLKSKGSPCDDVGDPDIGDGQANCNVTRTLAAQAMADWLATDPTDSGDPDFLIIGDLNAYDKEDPIDALVAAGYTDLLLEYQGEFAYSFVFDGQLGYLDHALANENLVSQVTGATVWHINADEPDILDYNTDFKSPNHIEDLYAPDPYRSSDHDPVIVGLALNEAPVCDAARPSLTSLWPPEHQFVSIDILDVTDPDGDPITITIDSIFQDEAVDADDSGNTAPDGAGIGTGTAQVRAERVGTADGRVYYITFTATDGRGGSCTGTVEVGVPVSVNSTAIGGGPLFDSTMLP